MKRKYAGRGIASALIALLCISIGACTSDGQKKPAPAAVGPQGATVQAHGITITVPPGAVKADTELVVSTPKRVLPQESPFGLATSTRVDISLNDNIQPDKPLDVEIPLTGTFLPDGARREHALLYHRLPNNAGFRVVPATVENNALRAQLPHLSEWDVVYLDEATLEEAFGNGALRPVSRNNCKADVTAKSTGKVKVGGKGWSTASNSLVRACLFTDGNTPSLSIANQANYMLPVAATGGLTISSPPKDAEEDMVRLIAKTVFPDARVKAFLGRGGELTATLPANRLPATIQLTGDPSTFLSESIWFAMKFIGGIALGKRGDEIAKDIKLILDTPQILSCLKSTLEFSQGKVPSMGDVVELITSKCAEKITEALRAVAANANLWDRFWNRFFTIGEGVIGGWNNFWTGVEGIRLQLHGTITVQVAQVAMCPSASEFQSTMQQHFSGDRVKATGPKVCQNGWAYGYTQLWLNDTNGWSDGMHTILRWNGSKWTVYHAAGTGAYFNGLDDICDKVPSKIRAAICVTV